LLADGASFWPNKAQTKLDKVRAGWQKCSMFVVVVVFDKKEKEEKGCMLVKDNG
jgi:hypothetical protein